MIISLNWLSEYVDFDLTPEDLSDRLTMSGIEVESIEYRGKGIEDVVVARILDIAPHPDADKLSLCSVTDGENDYSVVCGAGNMKPGDMVALARIGTALPPGPKFPEGVKIKKARIRGQASEGMLCAEDELGLGMESEGIMILPAGVAPGARLIDALGINDVILEIGITPNRPDCLSVVGVAREVGAILGKDVRYPDTSLTESGGSIADSVSVELRDPERCPRYTCRLIKNVAIGPSPSWLKTRLEASGVRSINNVVDVTNYVLLELGQPLHAFDYDLIKGRRIVVRHAREGEKINTLDGIERSLSGDDLLICDSESPIALAGVMGGADTEVSGATVNILLESAYFKPESVRRTSRRTGLRSESSYRFERGVDPEGVTRALDRAAGLMRELSGGEIAAGAIDEYPARIEPAEVAITTARTGAILGTEIDTDEIAGIAQRLGLEPISSEPGELTFRIPSYRVDLTREIDLIEEVARLHGYGRIPTTLPSVVMKTDKQGAVKRTQSRFKEIFTSSGFCEAINYSFEDMELLGLFGAERTVGILNPISREGSVMRTGLTAGLVKNIALNLNRQENDVRLFEAGKVYIPAPEDGLPGEINKFAAAAAGRRLHEFWDREEFDFFDLKSLLEKAFDALSVSPEARFRQDSGAGFLHPGKSAVVTIGDRTAGYIGELHPGLREKLGIVKRVYVTEIDLDVIAALSHGAKKSFSALPKFPSVRRDIALIVDEGTPADSIIGEIRGIGSGLIEDARVFDVFSGGPVRPGKKSVAVALNLRAPDKTLTEDEINDVQEKALKKLQLALGAELRTI